MTIYLVVAMAIFSQIGFGGSRVVMSLHALELGANHATVGIIIALYSVCPLLFSIPLGRLSDRIPPRRPMILGSLLLAAALVLPALWPSIPMLFVAAFCLGLGHMVFDIPLEAAVGGIGGGRHRGRNYALITMGWSLANFVGPLITGLSIDGLAHRATYCVLAAFVLLPILMFWRWPDLLPHAARIGAKETRGGVMELLRIRELRATYIAGGIIGSAQNLFQFYMPVYGHSLGLSASAIGTVLGMVALSAFFIRAAMPLLLRRLDEMTILKGAIFVAAFAYGLFPFFSTATALAAISFLLGLGMGCAQPMVMSLFYVLAPSGRIAEATGVYKTLRGVTHIVVPVLFGGLGTAFGFMAVFLSNAAMLGTAGYLQRNATAASRVKKHAG
jgi:MFS family permease